MEVYDVNIIVNVRINKVFVCFMIFDFSMVYNELMSCSIE